MPSRRRKDLVARSPLLKRIKRNIHKMKHTLDDLVAAASRRDAKRKRSTAASRAGKRGPR